MWLHLLFHSGTCTSIICTLANQSKDYVIRVHVYTPFTSYTQDGAAALYVSSQEGHVDVVRFLIEANAQVNQQTKVQIISVPYTSSV